jgi:uncharacterized membrane protein YoaK (UPF0700 family)
MLLRQGEARSDQVDRQLGWILAAIAGAVNTAAFHAVGFFSANMTGNVSSMSNKVAFGDWGPGLFFFSILLVFILGSFLATQLVGSGKRNNNRGIYAIVILLEALLMMLLGGACLLLTGSTRGAVLVLGLSFLMGLQNAAVTRISDARVRTTHVSGMSTDIGIELALLLDMALGRESLQEQSLYRRRLRLHSQTLLAFLLGGIAGVAAYKLVGIGFLFVTATILLAMASRSLLQLRQLKLPVSVDANQA